jgi:hypothetical protein
MIQFSLNTILLLYFPYWGQLPISPTLRFLFALILNYICSRQTSNYLFKKCSKKMPQSAALWPSGVWSCFYHRKRLNFYYHHQKIGTLSPLPMTVNLCFISAKGLHSTWLSAKPILPPEALASEIR